MILVLGSSADKVYPWLVSQLRTRDHPFVVVDEEYPERYEVQCDEANGRPRFRITGDHCRGENPVGSIFVRHAVARTLSPGHLHRMGLLQTNLNRMLLFTSCPIVNPPANAYSNYSKPFQVGLLAEAGFEVPRTLVTNLPDEARRFYAECERQVIYKGVSNVMTLAQVLTPDQFERLAFLPNSPTLFQEFVAGVDYRVHVVDGEAFVTRLVARNEDYRRSLLVTDEEVAVEPAHLPASVIDRCLAFTRQLGLIVSGIDFKETVDGRLVALELNPYPQFTFYERRSGQSITNAVVEYLIGHQATETDLFA